MAREETELNARPWKSIGLIVRMLPLLLSTGSWAQGDRLPNIVIILTDDQGYADISHNPYHPPEVSTPNMDALAREGIFFTQAYTSGNVCAPTRAGLMMGRYQQRIGFYSPEGRRFHLPPEEKLLPEYLKEAGYATGALGKWHLGTRPRYHPSRRGFDEFYGFMGLGAHDYFRLDDSNEPMYRDMNVIEDSGYLTTRLTEEALDFIQRHKHEPFFLYLAYNAVHAPGQAPGQDVALFDTGNKDRDILMAMLKHLDMGVGEVVAMLKRQGVWENTLLFYLTDNGGAKGMHAVNSPLRGWKGSNYEGGIRTPFVVSWPAGFDGGREITTPVISLDILPTVLEAAGIPAGAAGMKPLDGKSLLPVLRGETGVAHENLFWSEGPAKGEWAVRSGDWKLVADKTQVELFNLRQDISERRNLSAEHPEKVRELTALHESWLEEMPEPRIQWRDNRQKPSKQRAL